MSPQDKVLLLMAATVSFVLVATSATMMLYGPEKMPNGGALLADVTKFMTGVLAGAIVTKKSD